VTTLTICVSTTFLDELQRRENGVSCSLSFFTNWTDHSLINNDRNLLEDLVLKPYIGLYIFSITFLRSRTYSPSGYLSIRFSSKTCWILLCETKQNLALLGCRTISGEGENPRDTKWWWPHWKNCSKFFVYWKSLDSFFWDPCCLWRLVIGTSYSFKLAASWRG